MISSCHNGKIEIAEISDLENMTVGCQAGTTGESFLAGNFNSIKIKTYRNGNMACLALENGDVDAVVLDEFPARAFAGNSRNLKIVDLNLPAEEYAVAVRKGDTELLSSINSTIKKMKDAGIFEMLRRSFFPADGNIIIPEISCQKYEQTIKMGTSAAFPPFEYTKGTDVAGFDVSLAAYIAGDLSKNLHVYDMAFLSLFDALESGSIDFICAGMSVTQERRERVDFSEPYFTTRQVVIVRK